MSHILCMRQLERPLVCSATTRLNLKTNRTCRLGNYQKIQSTTWKYAKQPTKERKKTSAAACTAIKFCAVTLSTYRMVNNVIDFTCRSRCHLSSQKRRYQMKELTSEKAFRDLIDLRTVVRREVLWRKREVHSWFSRRIAAGGFPQAAF